MIYLQMTLPTCEEIKKLLTPTPPDLSELSLYEPAPVDLTRYTECCGTEPAPVSEEEIDKQVERQLQQWCASLDPAEQAILRGEDSDVVLREEGKENEDNAQITEDMGKSNGHLAHDVINMDIEMTAEIPKGVMVTPVTEIKASRRAKALRSHQTDSVKRARRSARF